MKKYNLEITEDHADIINAALELYSRIGMGQFEVISEQATTDIDYYVMKKAANMLKADIGIPPDQHYGIRSKKISDNCSCG